MPGRMRRQSIATGPAREPSAGDAAVGRRPSTLAILS